MGRILHVVAYISGLEGDGSDIHTDYVLKKRNQLTAHANALADFGNTLMERDRWQSAKFSDCCEVETIVETNLNDRPELHKLRKRKEDGEELSLVVVEDIDLCRRDPTENELAAFQEIIWPYISVAFSAGFSHEKRMSPIERAKTTQESRLIYQNGKDLLFKIFSIDHSSIPLADLDDLQRKFLAHVSDANGLLQKIARRKE